MSKKRRIVLIVGSESDLKYCLRGIEELLRYPEYCIFEGLYIRSPLFHPVFFDNLIVRLADSCDVIIVGAGMSHHPAVKVDAILRQTKRNTGIPVIGVAFNAKNGNSERCMSATEMSLSESPNSQVVYRKEDTEEGCFFGEAGFFQACKFAIFGKFPEIFIPNPRPMRDKLFFEEIRELVLSKK